MLDVSARPCVPADAATFAAPMKKFVRMVENIEESFLTAGSWRKVRRRIVAASKTKKLKGRGAPPDFVGVPHNGRSSFASNSRSSSLPKSDVPIWRLCAMHVGRKDAWPPLGTDV
jgi:hypothetical protein